MFIPTAICQREFVAKYSGAPTGLLPQLQHVAVVLPIRMVNHRLAANTPNPPSPCRAAVRRAVCLSGQD